MLTGWTVEHILKMKAKTFFAMNVALKKARHTRDAYLMRELVAIAAVPMCGDKYAKDLASNYETRFAETPVRDKKAMDPKDPYTAQVIASIFRSKKRTMGIQ